MNSRESTAPASAAPWYRHFWPWFLCGLLGLALLLSLSLDPLAGYLTRKGLSRLHGYRADFCDVHVSLWRPGYQIDGLRLVRANQPDTAEPVLFIDRIEAFPVVEELFQGSYFGL